MDLPLILATPAMCSKEDLTEGIQPSQKVIATALLKIKAQLKIK